MQNQDELANKIECARISYIKRIPKSKQRDLAISEFIGGLSAKPINPNTSLNDRRHHIQAIKQKEFMKP